MQKVYRGKPNKIKLKWLKNIDFEESYEEKRWSVKYKRSVNYTLPIRIRSGYLHRHGVHSRPTLY